MKFSASCAAAMRQAGYDALVAFSQDNVTYTAGFLVPSHASNRFRRTITILAGDTLRGADRRQRRGEPGAAALALLATSASYNQFTQDPADVLADALHRGRRRRRAASRSSSITCRRRTTSGSRSGCRRRPSSRASDLYFNARMIKTDEEVAILRKVGALTDRVAGEVLREIKPGMTEKAVGQIIGNKMMEGGCDGLKIQVGSGVRSGITNCTPTDKAIEQGDVIRVEILGDMKQYRSNVTRTAVLGEPTDEQKRHLGRDDRRARDLQGDAQARHSRSPTSIAPM